MDSAEQKRLSTYTMDSAKVDQTIHLHCLSSATTHNQRYLRVSAPLAMGVYCETGRRTRTHFVLSVFRDHKPMKKSDYL
uniref:Uncharacterized protein n=1 Tax=Loa loa TaxID=7209 RepID=A0A1I7VE88_LOALO